MKYILMILMMVNYLVASSFELEIKKGWNLLAVPIEKSIELSQMGEFNQIWVYENGWIKEPSTIKYGVGFWLKSDNSYSITFEGNSYEVDFSNLRDGWNLLGAGVDLNLGEFNFEKSLSYENSWIENPPFIKRGSGFWVKDLNRVDDWNPIIVDESATSPYPMGTASPMPTPMPMATASPTMSPMPTPMSAPSTEVVLTAPGNTNIPSPFGDTSVAPGEFSGSSDIGFAVGGAKDIGNFRENIKNDYLPLPSDITYEGLFYDYSFNTGITKECNELFCPSYTRAVTNDPLSQNEELYLSVGLNSGIMDFKRKKLNLVVVLDISSSMSSSFDSYYYDGEYISESKSKMELARESIANMTKHLRDSDKLGIVLFNGYGRLVKPLSLVANSDMDKIREHILELSPQGGTNMSAGLDMGFSLFEEIETDMSEYENRVIFLTDAMPNLGTLSSNSLASKIDTNAKNGIFTTFIGVGVDFNSELIEFMTKTEGANYYSIHNSNEFKKRLDEEFEFMVTPLVFNLELTLKSNKYSIEKVFGTPEADETTGEIMKINTLFPSKSENSEVKGGIVLIKLKKESEGEDDLNLTVSYRDRSFTPYTNSEMISFDDYGEYFENSGIKKGILLVRYANLLKNWIIEERNYCQKKEIYPILGVLPPPWIEYAKVGIVNPLLPYNFTWERTSCELMISNKYKEVFSSFKDYFVSESETLNDEDLNQEVEVLDFLIGY